MNARLTQFHGTPSAPWRGMCVLLAACCLAFTGCRDEEEAHGDREHQAGETHAETAPDSGFQQEMGVFVSESTKAMLGLQTTPAVEKTLTKRTEGTARVYAPGKATALIEANTATSLAPGKLVTLGAGQVFTGTLARIDRQLETSLGQVEVLIDFNKADAKTDIGTSVPLAFDTAETSAAPTVPESSMLETGEGSFLFVAKDGHFRRTRVEPAARADGWVQLAGGINAGEMVVTRGVQRLWCIELQATKAGTACCPVSDK